MATTNEIKAMATDISSEKGSISRKRGSFGRLASSTAYNWRGKTGEAFKDMSRQLKGQSETVDRDYSNVYSRLMRLADSFSRAEADKKRVKK